MRKATHRENKMQEIGGRGEGNKAAGLWSFASETSLSSSCLTGDNHEMVPLPLPIHRATNNDQTHSDGKRWHPRLMRNVLVRFGVRRQLGVRRRRLGVRRQLGVRRLTDHHQEGPKFSEGWSGGGGVLVQGWLQRWLCQAVPWIRWVFFQLKWVSFSLRTFPRGRGTYFVGLGTSPRMHM